jgi:hypothetical protein
LGGTSRETPLSESVKSVLVRVTHPSLGCTLPYCPRQKFDFDDDTEFFSKATSKKINSILQDMGTNNISGKMLKNPLGDENTRCNVHKQPPIEDMKSKTV